MVLLHEHLLDQRPKNALAKAWWKEGIHLQSVWLFMQKADHLKTHMLVHSGLKLHPCNLCPQSFKTSGELKTHGFNHMGIKSHPCDQCPKCLIGKTEDIDVINEDYMEKELNSFKLHGRTYLWMSSWKWKVEMIKLEKW